jgi:pimeloyl-ACP methyl ester carboxylesterase
VIAEKDPGRAVNRSSTTTWRETSTDYGAPWPVVVSERKVPPAGTALVLHGRNGAPDQPQVAAIVTAYVARGWRVVAPELPCSAALPGSGPPSELTMARYRHAAAEVRAWVTRRWPDGRLALAGHSLGAYAAAHVAGEIQGLHHLLAVSPALSGRALLEARLAMGPQAVAALEREAPLMRAEMEAEDATDALKILGAPLAVVSGARDGIVPLRVARAYFDAAPLACFFAALPDQHHCPAGPDVDLMLAAALTALDA